MIRKEGNFAGHGGLRLYWQAWLPEQPARAALIVAHGYGEHGGRYANLVDHLVPRGFAVYALDHRGHGRSEGPRGHVRRFDEYVSDLHALRVRVEEEARELPLFVLGHSMGGLIAIQYALAHPAGLAGVAMSSPALAAAARPSRALVAIAKVLSLVWPRASFQGPVDPAALSRDGAVGRAYAADPLVHRRLSARFYTELFRAMADALERAPELTVPMLVLQAGDDRLTEASAARAFAARAPGERMRFIEYAGFFHELFNEIERARVLADLESWLEERLKL